MMMKNGLFAVALLSVALCAGCATGGGGHQGVQVTVSDGNVSVVGVTLTVQFTADVTGSDNHAVTWSVKQNGAACNACGTIDASGLYTAPAAAPTPADVDVVATSQADTGRSGSLTVTVVQITVTVTPTNNPFNVVKGVTQQFTATATPDAAPQTFTWNLACDDPAPGSCGNLDQSGLYTAPAVIPNPATARVTATSTIDRTGVGTVDIIVVKSRLNGSSTYAFRLSGFDANGPIAVAGNFTTNADGTAITGGTEDDLTIGQYSNPTITGGSLSLDTNDHGTLILNTTAGARAYKVGLNANGDGRMIEFDGTGRRGSGEIAQATKSKFNNGALPAGSSFVFGLTGEKTVTQRAGFAGLFKPDGFGVINSGLLDRNENGVPGSANDVTGAYDIEDSNGLHPGHGTMTLTSNSLGKTYNYAIYVVGGQTNKANNPLTLFVISTDNPLTNPAVSGTIVFQDPTPAYGLREFNDFSVSSLTGVDASGHTLVSLTNSVGDGNGHVNGTYDANNAGVIVSAKSFNNYGYAPTGSGRYSLDLLGDPAANPVVPPVHFVLYCSANSRGFLLDQSSAAVYTGQMDLQPGSDFAGSEMAGSFAAGTANPGTSGVSQAALNLLFTSVVPNFTVGGKRDETDGGQNAGQTLAGTYAVNLDGTGTMTIAPNGQPDEHYVIYLLDNPKSSGDMIQHFVMMNVDPANTDSSIIFAER
ncbi:MAG: hypothetical protein WAQ52_19590 [Terriglobales bacterium]